MPQASETAKTEPLAPAARPAHAPEASEASSAFFNLRAFLRKFEKHPIIWNVTGAPFALRELRELLDGFERLERRVHQLEIER